MTLILKLFIRVQKLKIMNADESDDVEEGRNESFLSRVKNKVPKVSPTTKGQGKTGLAIITNLVLPAIDEITDFVSGFRFLW